MLYVQVMEKIRPIDQKLKYQIDKLIKIATTGLVGMSLM
jgi:U3 small nucleolar ribonucleoprotein protein LCP5